jgi:hypothetical protein
MQFLIQHNIKQDPLPGGLNVLHKPPMSARLPTSNAAHDCVVPPEDKHPFVADPTLLLEKDIVDPDLTPEFGDGAIEIDTSQLDYPWPPTANYATRLQHPSATEVDFPFGYRSL